VRITLPMNRSGLTSASWDAANRKTGAAMLKRTRMSWRTKLPLTIAGGSVVIARAAAAGRRRIERVRASGERRRSMIEHSAHKGLR
jgi:hypothetical protein